MENKYSSNGLAEDVIRSFVQIGSAEMHAKTLLEIYVSEMENGLVDLNSDEAMTRQIERIDAAKDEICALAQLRRSDMLYLYQLFGGKGQKEKWCTVKHLGIAMMTAFEAWQASSNDERLLELALQKNRLFIRSLTQFLGVEVTECASCFTDILKGETANE